MIENSIEIDESIVKLKHERLHAITSRAILCLDAMHFEIAKSSNMLVVHLEKRDKLNSNL